MSILTEKKIPKCEFRNKIGHNHSLYKATWYLTVKYFPSDEEQSFMVCDHCNGKIMTDALKRGYKCHGERIS